MKTYLKLQCKRILGLLPGAAALMLALLLGLVTLAGQFTRQNQQENSEKIRFVICGDVGDSMLQLGLSALQSFDESRFAMEILQMPLEEARQALAKGEIAAYAIVPQGFVDAAQHGELLPIEFVTSLDAQGMVMLFKTEITDTVSRILISAQRSIFGGHAAMVGVGETDRAGWYLYEYAFENGEYVALRNQASQIKNLGIGGAPDFITYLICGISVIFLCLCCLCFAPAMILRRTGLHRMLTARGHSGLGLALSDYSSLALGLTLLMGVSVGIPLAFGAGSLGLELPPGLILYALPVLLTVSAFSFFFYSLTGDLVSGVLLQFLGVLCLCFVSGCMYPGFFFPEAVQKLGDWLPMGICRRWLSGCFTGETELSLLGLMLSLSAAAIFGGAALRIRRIRDIQGVTA